MKVSHIFVIILVLLVGGFCLFITKFPLVKMCEISVETEVSSDKFTATTLTRGCGVGSSDYAFVNVRKKEDAIEDSDYLSDEQVFLIIDSEKLTFYWKDGKTLTLNCSDCLVNGIDKANSIAKKSFRDLKIEYQKIQNNVSVNSETKFGYVPDEKTAIDIALKVWIPIYGKETIESEKPYIATLKNGVWVVTGSLPEGMDGGVAEVQISQKDGKVLKIIHGK